MEEYIEVGKVLKPQGLKGMVKINSYSDKPENYLDYKHIFLGTQKQKYNLGHSYIQKGCAYLELDGIESIEQAEKLRNKPVFIESSQLAGLENDEWYFADLIGCDVETNVGTHIGEVTAMDSFSSTEVVTVLNKNTKKESMFPFLDDVIISVDINSKKIVVDAIRLSEVVTDED